MNTYEKLIKREKRYRAGLRFEYPVMFIVPALAVALFLMKMLYGRDPSEKVEAVIAFVITFAIYGGIILAMRFIDGKDRSPAEVESDFEAMRAEAGASDPESFNEMLEKMVCYEDHIFIDHNYFLDFRLLRVVPVKSIISVRGISELERYGKYSQRRTNYFVMMYADVPLKIACRNRRSQEKLLSALNLAIIEKEHIYGKGRSVPKAKKDTLRTSGDAEMDEL